jgi:lipopolysaccharide transport system permease protein
MMSGERTLDLDAEAPPAARDARPPRPAPTTSESPAEPTPELIIEPRPGWRALDLGEIARYRDLFYFLTWRGIKARYAQSVLGVGWAVVQPVVSMLVFTVIFGRLARMDSDGRPYALFAFCGLVPWTFFANALQGATQGMTHGAQMLTKIYFPRPILPASAVTSRLVDLSITLTLLLAMLAVFRVWPRAEAVVLLPMLIVVLYMAALGVGLWLAALAVQYRDVAYAMPFTIQILMYLSPVVYPLTKVPARYQWLYGLNPMAGVIGGFRAVLLGSTPIPWPLIAESAAVSLALLVGGALYFRRMERLFADVA